MGSLHQRFWIVVMLVELRLTLVHLFWLFLGRCDPHQNGTFWEHWERAEYLIAELIICWVLRFKLYRARTGHPPTELRRLKEFILLTPSTYEHLRGLRLLRGVESAMAEGDAEKFDHLLGKVKTFLSLAEIKGNLRRLS